MQVYQNIENSIQEVEAYIQTWSSYQSLWDMDAGTVYEALGDDMGKWHQILLEIKESRATFDNSDTRQDFGCLFVDHSQVQSRVNNKYDAWNREVLSKFGAKLQHQIQETCASISKARADLEGQTIQSSSTAQAVEFVTHVQELKRTQSKLNTELELHLKGQR